MSSPRRLFRLYCALAAAACVAHAEDAPRVEVRIVPHDGDLVIVASARLAADASTAWSVLTDYAGYRDFVPGVRSSRVIEREGTRVVVEQSDELAFWRVRMPVQVTYEIAEFPPARITSRALASSMPPLEGTFVLEREGTGVRLDYVGHIGAGMPILGRLEQPAVQQAALSGFRAIASEIERRSAAARVH